MEGQYDRFKTAPWFKPDLNIILGGCGGGGTYLMHYLSKLDFNIYAFDNDVFSAENIGCQLFDKKYIGKNKAASCSQMTKDYSDSYKVNSMRFYSEDSIIDNIVFCAFDSMHSRKIIFDKWKAYQLSKTPEYRKEHPDEINWFSDTRVTAETAIMYFINSSDDIKRYEEEFFSDSEASETTCSLRSTSHCNAISAGYEIAAFTNHITNKLAGYEIREVPFKMEIILPLLTQTIIR